MIHPVTKENIRTGHVGTRVHGVEARSITTLCGQSLSDGPAHVQFSVEPEGTPITCPKCREAMTPLHEKAKLDYEDAVQKHGRESTEAKRAYLRYKLLLRAATRRASRSARVRGTFG